MTAVTRAGTLSRVMTSWGGTSRVTVLKSILTILSISGRRMKSPGPLGPPWTRPRRKITPRSYSLTTLMALNKTDATTTMATTRAMNAKPIRQCSSPVDTNHADPTTARRTPDTRGKPVLDLPLSLPLGQRDSLEEPPRPDVAIYVVYAGDGHLVMDLGVDGSPVAHGYADVGDVSAA